MICAKTAEAIEMPSGMWTGGPKEPCMKCGPGFPRGRDRFFWGGGYLTVHWEEYRISGVSQSYSVGGSSSDATFRYQ